MKIQIDRFYIEAITKSTDGRSFRVPHFSVFDRGPNGEFLLEPKAIANFVNEEHAIWFKSNLEQEETVVSDLLYQIVRIGENGEYHYLLPNDTFTSECPSMGFSREQIQIILQEAPAGKYLITEFYAK